MRLNPYLLLALSTIFLVSCGDDHNEDENELFSPYAITFGTEINGFSTRVTQSGDRWRSEDVIGVYMFASGTFDPFTDSANIPYTCFEDRASTAFSSTSPLAYPANGEPVDFMAYYPYSADIQGIIYPIELSNQQFGSSRHDLMYATSEGDHLYKDESDAHVDLTFSHQLSKVILNFVNKNDETIKADEIVTIQGMNTEATFNLTSGELTAVNNTSIAIKAYRNVATGYYEAIVLPSDLADTHTAICIHNGTTYTWKFTNTDIKLAQLDCGYKYIFTIPLVSGTAGTAKVTMEGGNSSSPWADGESISGMAPAVNYNLFPESSGAFADTELKISFKKNDPVIGTSGYIRIYSAKDGSLVDEINMRDKQVPIEGGVTTLNTSMDIIGVTPKASKKNRKRVVNYRPVKIEGNTVIIKPHSQRLAYNTSYYVTVDKEVIKHADFNGVSGVKWTFNTRKEPVVPTDAAHTVTVSHNNKNADFYTVQGAIDYFAVNLDRNVQKTIYIENGTYEEMINLRDQDNITFKGQSRDGVRIQYDNNNMVNGGTNEGDDIDQFAPVGTVITSSGNRSVITIAGDADKIRFETLTIANIYGAGAQAEAIILRSGKAATFIDCNLYGYQDTVYMRGGYIWFYNSLITGAVDFIWGGSDVTLFENCEIKMIAGGRGLNARVAAGNLGYVFHGCSFTVADGIAGSTKLIESSTNDNITFVNCTLADSYVAAGFGKLTPEIPNLTDGCKMYNSFDVFGNNVIDIIDGKEYIYKLTEAEYNTHFSSRGIILNGYDNTGAIWFVQ